MRSGENDWLATGGNTALKKALGMLPEQVAAEVDAAWVSTFQDTNHNGVRSAEIRDGTDVPVDRPSVLVAAGAGIEMALNDPTTPVRPGDRVLLFASINFDASVSELVMAFAAGATIHVASRDEILPGDPFVPVEPEGPFQGGQGQFIYPEGPEQVTIPGTGAVKEKRSMIFFSP